MYSLRYYSLFKSQHNCLKKKIKFFTHVRHVHRSLLYTDKIIYRKYVDRLIFAQRRLSTHPEYRIIYSVVLTCATINILTLWQRMYVATHLIWFDRFGNFITKWFWTLWLKSKYNPASLEQMWWTKIRQEKEGSYLSSWQKIANKSILCCL